MKQTTRILTLAASLFICLHSATNAHAMKLEPTEPTPKHHVLHVHANPGQRANSHLPKPKHHKPHPKSCTTVEQIGWSIDLSDYQDGDTPYPTYYSDYLSDLGWYVNEFNACPITPEPDPGQ